MNAGKEKKILRRLELMESKLAKMESTIALLSSQRLRLKIHVDAIKRLLMDQISPDQDDPDE